MLFCMIIVVSAFTVLTTLLAVGALEVKIRWKPKKTATNSAAYRAAERAAEGVQTLERLSAPRKTNTTLVRKTNRKRKQRNASSAQRKPPSRSNSPYSTAGHAGRQPSTLMVLTGQLRGGELAWESMRRNVMMQFNVTLALVAPCLNGSRPTTLHNLSTYDWCYREPYDWEALFDSVNCSAVVNPATAQPWSNSSSWRTGLCDRQKTPGRILGGLPSCVRSMPRWDCYGGLSPSPETIEKCRYVRTCIHGIHTLTSIRTRIHIRMRARARTHTHTQRTHNTHTTHTHTHTHTPSHT